MRVLKVRNVNEALREFLQLSWAPTSGWRDISPRGLRTMEWYEPVATVYGAPRERVLFDPVRDANPFFHLMESIWILAGRSDVEFLAKYNAKMASFSDDGKVFHAPYGARLRKWPDKNGPIDQIKGAVEMLREDPRSRQVVMSIWDPAKDFGMRSKDIPCNDFIMLKVRDDRLNMTVCCRSNDVIWGAYGANVVQFSTLQEFMARAIGVGVGTYTQISDSYHYYTDNEAYARLHDEYLTKGKEHPVDPYSTQYVSPYPLMQIDYRTWLWQAEAFCAGSLASIEGLDPFFINVAGPMQKAWDIFKDEYYGKKKRARIEHAVDYLAYNCLASDWCTAATRWLLRRMG
jgi:hypothetical protein